MRFPLMAASVLVLVALAGCISDEAALTDDGTGNANTNAATTTTPTGSSGPGSGTSGSASGGNAAPTPTAPAAPPRDPVVTEDNGNFLIKVHAPLGAPLAAGNDADQFRLDFETANGFIIILEWTASNQLTEELRIWARKNPGTGQSFDISGRSPLILPMDRNESSGEKYLVDILPTTAPRLGVNQGFSYRIAAFENMPFDPDWRPADLASADAATVPAEAPSHPQDLRTRG